jgi:hypothetical protein
VNSTEAQEGDLIFTKYGFYIFVKFGAKYNQRGVHGPKRVYARHVHSDGRIDKKAGIAPYDYLVIARPGCARGGVWENGYLRVAMNAWRGE